MSKQIAKLLKADISESSDLMRIARMLEKKGRGNDTLLAHITMKEAQMLKDAGGAGTVNPETGLLEFYDGYDGMSYAEGESYVKPVGYNYSQPSAADFGPTRQEYESGISATSPTYYQQAPAAPVRTQSAYDLSLNQEGLRTGGRTGFDAGDFTPSFYSTPNIATAQSGVGYGVGSTTVPSVAVPRAATELTADKGGGVKGFFDKMTDEQKLRLGLAGGLGLFGVYQGRQAGKETERRAGEMQALGRPYQAQGTELQRAAMSGELTPQSAQAYQALQARLAQGVEQRGGVGAQQAAAQAEAFRQQLLAQQYNLGLQVSNIGDNIAIGAIRTGMQADQQLSQVNNAFFTNLAAIAAGMPMRS
jgi:hypothetical protein